MKTNRQQAASGGLHRTSKHAARIRAETADPNTPFHPIETLAALLSKHRSVRPYLEKYLGPIAARKGNRVAAGELERLDKNFLRMGVHTVPMKGKEIDRLAHDLASTCKRIVAQFGLNEKAVQHCRFRSRITGVEPLDQKQFGLIPTLNRYICELWWRHRLHKTHARCVERFFREIGVVQRARQSYASDWSVSQREDQRIRHVEFFQRFDVVSDQGDILPLEDVVKSSQANPRNRRAELMTRLRGMEEIAEEIGSVPIFATLTVPSRFHRTLSTGEPNEKYDGSTPIDAQHWLRKRWERTRAALHRRDVQIYGFRIAEPHHDGTPHWHLLVFTDSKSVEIVEETLLRYWLADEGDEPGAQKHRVRFVDIDPKKGSATGYVAKYVSKAIDGNHIDSDNAGNTGTEASKRVLASCATWGIRQFQQIGGPPVSVWRELRRLASRVTDPSLERIRLLADQGDWRGFVFAMGGPYCPRKAQLVCLVSRTVNSGTTRYGDYKTPEVVGVLRGPAFQTTRLRSWTLQERAAA